MDTSYNKWGLKGPFCLTRPMLYIYYVSLLLENVNYITVKPILKSLISAMYSLHRRKVAHYWGWVIYMAESRKSPKNVTEKWKNKEKVPESQKKKHFGGNRKPENQEKCGKKTEKNLFVFSAESRKRTPYYPPSLLQFSILMWKKVVFKNALLTVWVETC